MPPLYQHTKRQKISTTPTAIMTAANWTRGSQGGTPNSTASNQGANLVFTQNGADTSQGYVHWASTLINPYSAPKTTTIVFEPMINNTSDFGISLGTNTGSYYVLLVQSYLTFTGYNNSIGGWTATNISTPYGNGAWSVISGMRLIDSGTDLTIQYSTDYGVTWSTSTVFGPPNYNRSVFSLTGNSIRFKTPNGSVYTLRNYTCV